MVAFIGRSHPTCDCLRLRLLMGVRGSDRSSQGTGSGGLALKDRRVAVLRPRVVADNSRRVMSILVSGRAIRFGDDRLIMQSVLEHFTNGCSDRHPNRATADREVSSYEQT